MRVDGGNSGCDFTVFVSIMPQVKNYELQNLW